MPNPDQAPHLDRLSSILRESLNQFMELLDLEERKSPKHEDQVHYEEWVRYLLATSLIPDILAVACGVFECSSDIFNTMPALLENSLATIPVDAEFIRNAMARLPDHPRMMNPNYDSLGDEARSAFNAALYHALNIEELD